MAVVVGAALWGAIAEIRSTDLSSESASGSSADLSGPNKVVTANDGKSQVTVPASWKDVPAAVQNELAAIQVGNLPRGQYIAVITGDKGDFDGFDGFSSACVEEARILFEDAEIGERRDLTIGGLPAVKYEITGKANGIRLVYWYAMVEGENAYYQVIGWTMPSRQAESEPVITEVINSFRELGAT
jgi:hypothetical protein